MGLRLLAVALLVSLAVACSSNPAMPEDDSAAITAIEQHRAKVEREMRNDPNSPIPPDKKNILLPLRYYPPDPGYSVPAALKLAQSRPVMEMPTSTGVLRRMELVGTLEFTLKGQKMSLGAFVEEGTQRIDELFVPFADLTTGTETYPAGRYLNLKPNATGIYVIDFNKAYNPYCAYNNAYECPFPPSSNRLKVAILAGEKTPPEHAG
jgi:uncharacterized protein